MTNYSVEGIYKSSEEFYQSKEENVQLKTQLEKVINALEFYADESHYQKRCIDSRVGAVEEVIIDNGRIARNTLEECRS